MLRLTQGVTSDPGCYVRSRVFSKIQEQCAYHWIIVFVLSFLSRLNPKWDGWKRDLNSKFWPDAEQEQSCSLSFHLGDSTILASFLVTSPIKPISLFSRSNWHSNPTCTCRSHLHIRCHGFSPKHPFIYPQFTPLQYTRGAASVITIAVRNEIGEPRSNPGRRQLAFHFVSVPFGKGMNSVVLQLAMCKIVGQHGFPTHGKATIQLEGKH